MDEIKKDYEDIIDLPHYEPRHHLRMSRKNRAGQFAAFAALSGHAQMIKNIEKENERKYETGERK